MKSFIIFFTLAITCVLLVFLVIILNTPVDTFNLKLKIKNNWKKPIAVLYSTDSTKFDYGKYEYYASSAIQPNAINPIITRNFWEEVIDYSASRKLYLLVYDMDTLHKYKDMDYIVKNNLHISKLIYSKNDLIDRNWVVIFH